MPTHDLNRLFGGLITIATALLILPVTASEQAWELESEEDDVLIYTRAVADSPYRAVKAEMQINAPVERVSALMGSGEGCAEWRGMCKTSEVIETVSEQERYVYMVLDLPWPISDRDMVMHTRTEVDTAAQTATIHLQTESSRHPEQDYVRAESQGQYVIRVIAPGEVHFTYIMHADLGGELPPGTINSRLKKSAYEDMDRLRELAEG